MGGGEREGGREGEPRDNYVLRIRRSKKRARGGEPTTERSIDRSGKIPGSGCAILCIEVEDHQCGYDARETEWDRRGTEREKEKGKGRKEEEGKERERDRERERTRRNACGYWRSVEGPRRN